MGQTVLSKRALASLRASLAALRQSAIVFMSPQAALSTIEKAEQAEAREAVEADSAFSWMEGLAARQGAAPDELLIRPTGAARKAHFPGKPPRKASAVELMDLEQSPWTVGMSEDFLNAIEPLDEQWRERVAEALRLILQSPNAVEDRIQPLPWEYVGLWQYASGPLGLAYDTDFPNKRITLLLLTIEPRRSAD